MRRLVLVVLLSLAGLAVLSSALSAQSGGGGIRPLCVTGCQGDTIPPTISLLAPTGPVTAATPAINIGWCDNKSLQGSTRDIKVNGVDQTSAFTYGSNDGCAAYDTSGTTSVTLNIGANTLYSHICDSAGNCTSRTDTIVRTNAPFLVGLHNFNGDNQDRGLCLTVGAGQAAGVACGDLFVAHAMPAYRTMSRDRHLTLFYNSATAAPRPEVAVWVTQTQGSSPTTVYAELDVKVDSYYVKRASETYTGWSWKFGTGTRQIVLSYDAVASGDTTTGLYPFIVLVTNQSTGGSVTDTVTGSLLLVNRSASEFGAGWGIAGVERLVLGQAADGIVWLGGDGSAAVYDSIAPSTWLRRTGPFRDTLTFGTLSKRGPHGYRRFLRHGIQVVFDSVGHHIQTVDPVGNVTTFAWSGSPSRLTNIQVPPGIGGTTYSLVYNAANYLHSITDPAGRVLRDSVSGGNLTQLVDPDGLSVTLGYDASRRLTNRTGRRGFTTQYLYSRGLHVDSLRVPLQLDAGVLNDTARSSVAWWDEQGLAIGNRTDTIAAIDTGHVYTRVDGPRTDVQDIATFWVDRWGAPIRIVGPVNDTTLLTRDTATALVSRMRNPVGNVWTLTHDARGNVLTLTDSTHDGTGATLPATTRYTYDDVNDTRDDPDSVIDPVGVVTRFKYNGQLDTLVIGPNGQRTHFVYAAGSLNGLLDSVTDRQVRTDTGISMQTTLSDQTTALAYDNLGNVVSTTTPLGHVTYFYRNAYTQDTAVKNAVSNVTRSYPNIMGAVTSTIERGSTDSRTTYFAYDADFNRTSVIDPRGVTRSYSYDAAGRDTAETDDYGITERRWFDSSGLLDSILTRDSLVVRRTYDAAGRLTSTWFPYLLGHAPADSATYSYDAAGHLLTASNRSGKIMRTYYREGTLKQSQDTTYTGLHQTSDVFLQYRYLLNDQRAWFSDSASGALDAVWRSYTYDGAGQLRNIVIEYPFNSAQDTATYTWDGLGRLQQEVTPHRHMRATVNWYYDLDGRLRRINTSAQNNCYSCSDSAWVDEQYTTYDAVNRPLGITRYLRGNYWSQDSALFNAYGEESLTVVNGIPHQLSYDASGNLRSSVETVGSTPYSLLFVIDSGYPLGSHNRLVSDTLVDTQGRHWQENINYTGAGARSLEAGAFGWTGARAMTYDALQRMTQVTNFTIGWQCLPDRGDWLHTIVDASSTCTAWEQPNYVQDGFRYDALGRLVITPDGFPISYDGNQAVRVSGTRITYGPGQSNPIAVYDSLYVGETVHRLYYFITDGSGGLLSFTDSAGTDQSGPTPWFTYRDRAIHAGAIVNRHNFDAAARETNSSARLGFFQNRYYDQRTGRWTQEDPIGPAGGTNLYAYTGNNPITYTDPFGLCTETGGPDSLQIKVRVRCKGDPPEGSHQQAVWAYRVKDAGQVAKLGDVVASLQGGSVQFTPDEVRKQYAPILESGDVYTYSMNTENGGVVTTGGFSVPEGAVGFRSDLWNVIQSGVSHLTATTCQAVGHEGVHLVQFSQGMSQDAPLAEPEALDTPWSCQ